MRWKSVKERINFKTEKNKKQKTNSISYLGVLSFLGLACNQKLTQVKTKLNKKKKE